MKIPKPIERHAPLLVLHQQKHKLQLRANELKSESLTLRSRISNNAATFGNAAENRARAILGEPTLPTVLPDMERLDTVLRELHDINAALANLDGKIQVETGIASRIVCDETRPEVTAKAKTFAKAFLALHTAHTDYDRTLEDIENAGVNITSLGRIWPNALGGVKDRSGQYHYAFREFVDGGYMNKADVPECVR